MGSHPIIHNSTNPVDVKSFSLQRLNEVSEAVNLSKNASITHKFVNRSNLADLAS